MESREIALKIFEKCKANLSDEDENFQTKPLFAALKKSGSDFGSTSEPSIVEENYEEWRLHGVPHRIDGPAITHTKGDVLTREYWQNGSLHAIDRPAIEVVTRFKPHILLQAFYYQNGLLHREDGPALYIRDFAKKWYLNNLLHRQDGPAVAWSDGTVEYWMLGQKVERDLILKKKRFFLRCDFNLD